MVTVVVGNKADLAQDRAVATELAEQVTIELMLCLNKNPLNQQLPNFLWHVFVLCVCVCSVCSVELQRSLRGD